MYLIFRYGYKSVKGSFSEKNFDGSGSEREFGGSRVWWGDRGYSWFVVLAVGVNTPLSYNAIYVKKITLPITDGESVSAVFLQCIRFNVFTWRSDFQKTESEFFGNTSLTGRVISLTLNKLQRLRDFPAFTHNVQTWRSVIP